MAKVIPEDKVTPYYGTLKDLIYGAFKAIGSRGFRSKIGKFSVSMYLFWHISREGVLSQGTNPVPILCTFLIQQFQ